MSWKKPESDPENIRYSAYVRLAERNPADSCMIRARRFGFGNTYAAIMIKAATPKLCLKKNVRNTITPANTIVIGLRLSACMVQAKAITQAHKIAK